MPTFEITTPSGRTFEVTAPQGATQEEVLAFAQKYAPKSSKEATKEKIDNDAISKGAREFAGQGSDALGGASQAALNLLAGAVRGAGSIGATLARPFESGEENNERRKGIDKNMEAIGAQPDSFMYGAGKVGTEVAGTLAVGGVAGKTAGAILPAGKATTAIADGLATGGFRVGGATGVGGVTARVGTGAATGAAGAGLVNPDDATTGAVIGGVLPVAVKGIGTAANALTKGARHVAAAVSPKAAKSVAVERLGKALGDDASQVVADIGTHYPKGAEDIPLSAAAIARNPALAQMEQGSRLRAPTEWFEFDQKQGRAIFDNVLKATDEAGQLGERLANRRDNWRTMWATTSQNFKPKLWMARMTQFGGDLEQAVRSAEASNPSVRGVLEAINAEMDRVGPAFSPAHLQQLRANLNGKVQPLSPDVFKSAPRDSPAIKSLIKEMDDILNVSTGGKWQKVLEGYAKDSDLVRAAKAAAKVRSSFVDEATGRIRGTALDPSGDIPRITEAGLGRALDAARMPDKTLALSGDADQRLVATVDAIRRQNIVQQLKKTSSAGGGSDSIPNAIAAGASAAGTPNIVMQFIDAARKVGTAKTDRELAALLSNPDEMAKALGSWLKPAAPALPMSATGAGAARALPVLGAGALAAPVAAEDPPTTQPAAPAIGPISSIEPDPITTIASAQNVDEAIQGAFAALDAGGPIPQEPPAEPEPVIAEMPALLDAPATTAQAGEPAGQPVSIWTGRRGAGYIAPGDALMALRTRQKVEPDLNWRVEHMPNDRYRLAGYAREDGPGLMASAPPISATMNESGTALLSGDEGMLRQLLNERGITAFVRVPQGILVGRSQAPAAMQLAG